MNLIFPRFPLKDLPLIFSLTVLGAGIAGLYGIIHDEISYSISEEYFTKLKFNQFSYADFGFSVRVHVAEIGFLATWWVGFFSGWFLARYCSLHFSAELTIRYTLQGFAVILGCAFVFGLAGFVVGYYWLEGVHLLSWEGFQDRLGIDDLRDFARVGYIHNSGYLGALFGLLGEILYLRRIKVCALRGTGAGPAKDSCTKADHPNQ
jgi:hypothetical protein